MISYSTLGTNDMKRSIAFYDSIFGVIGGKRELTTETWVQYGRENEQGKVCLTTPHNRNPATNGNGTMLAFEAKDRNAVDAFHANAIAQGGSDAGLPGLREGTHYVAYARDPDGNKLCVFTPR